MSYSWAGMSNNMFPYSSSKQKIHIHEIMQVQVISHSREQIQCLHNQACMQNDFSYSREVNSRETSPWGGFQRRSKGWT